MRRVICVFFLCCLLSAAAQERGKYSPKFLSVSSARLAGTEKGNFSVRVKDIYPFISAYPAVKILFTHRQSNSLEIYTEYRLVHEKFRTDENILFVDIRARPTEESFLSDPDFAFNRIRKAQHLFPAINGKELLISVKERFFDVKDIDLAGRVILSGLESSLTSEHATNMATIIAGKGNTSPFFKGAVPSAMVTSSDYENLLPDDEELLNSLNVYLQNHSYGVGIENYYGVDAAAYDESVHHESSILHIFSAGNSGLQNPDHGIYAGQNFANLTGNFKHAKNVLTVSALDTSYAVSQLNSRGPAYDGRLKPELSAYGGRGTSDAAALASGISAMLQNKFFDLHSEFPKAALIKSVLIASAEDIGPEGIDYYTGYGNIHASNALNVVANSWHTTREISRNDSEGLNITIPEGAHNLRVVISWTDPPAAVNSAAALVNDVDGMLTLDGTFWSPWVLNATPGALEDAPTRSADHLNNVEFFSIENPEEGIYELMLSGDLLSTESQSVQVAWFYEIKEAFTWDYPTASDALASHAKTSIVWSETLSESNGILSFSYDGQNWVEIGEAQLSLNSQTWNVPDTSAYVRLRMLTGSKSFISDSFLISDVPDATVNYNCDNRFGLAWSKIYEASGYYIYEMGDTTLNLLATTADTTFTVTKSDAVFYSVAPNFSGQTGLRSPALNYSFQGTFCYINFFAAEHSPDNDIQVRLILSTTINIDHVVILKSFDETKDAVLSSFVPDGKTEFMIKDPSPESGLIRYRAVLFFQDGTFRESEVSELFIPEEGKAILFPNPLINENYLNVLSSGSGQQLQILDRNGRLLVEKELLFKVDYLLLHDLREGLYLYRLMEGKKILDTGKFLKY